MAPNMVNEAVIEMIRHHVWFKFVWESCANGVAQQA